MKKLLIKSIVFCIILLMPLLYLNMRYKGTNYFLQLNGLGKFRNVPNNIEVLNLGNSHEEAGIIYNDETIKGYNLALGSQPFEYDFYILDYYASHLSHGATVIIPISYFDWYYNYEELFMEKISVYNERYYTILDKEHIMNYEIKKDILYHKFPLLTAGVNMKYIFEDTEWSDFEINTTVVENIDSVAESKYDSWIETVMVSDSRAKEERKKRNQKFLKKTIEFCYDHGFLPVLVTLPMTNQLLSRFSCEFKEDFIACGKEVLREYPNLKYFNYSEDQEFAANLEYFKDSDHLNTNGAIAFSGKLFEDLRVEGLVK